MLETALRQHIQQLRPRLLSENIFSFIFKIYIRFQIANKEMEDSCGEQL